MKNLVLYYFEACPYCQKVLHFMKENNIQLTLKDIRAQIGAREELLKIGGKSQVPCLVINEKALYESLDIIEWLKTNFQTK